MLYAVQFQFNSDRLEVKASDVRIFTSVEDVVEASKSYILKEFDVDLRQPPKFRKEMALHWIKKGNTVGKQADELLRYMMENDYSLPFPFIKINDFEEGRKIGKLKPAVIINDNIYYCNQFENDIYKNLYRHLK